MADQDFQMPSFFGRKKIAHYYGDTIRNLFIFSAIINAVAMPLWGNLLPFGTLIGIMLILVVVFLAGVTNPHALFLMLVNVVVAGAGVFLIQAAAITYYKIDSAMLFFLRECVVILLLFAFYYSVKSARNMMLGKTGDEGRKGEFEKKE